MQFSDLRLAEPILRALTAEGYSTPTPIQAQAIPHVMAGKDLLGVAQTGTGKTAAFALPILHRLSAKAEGGGQKAEGGHRKQIRCLVLSPTRELALQIGDSFKAYGTHTGIRHTVIFGGVGQQAQVQAIKNGVDVLVCTPGRLIDLMNQGYIHLQHVEVFVLDEADRMLDMGFIHDIRRIVPKLPPKRQNLMFSATMPREISDLAHTILKNPTKVEVTPVSSTAERIEQSVYFVEKKNKPILLAHYLNNNAFSRALVFTRTKHGADRVVRQLDKAGIRAEAIHGNKSQNARQRALGNFKSGKTMVLIASDIAARGIDIDEISHVINYDLSNEPETYVHRIGRTGRAGATGIAVSFCDSEERSYLNAIQRLIKKEIPVKKDHPTYPARSVADELVQKSGGHGHGKADGGEGRQSRPPQQARHHAPRSQHAPHQRPVQPHKAPGGGVGAGRPHSPQAPKQPQRHPSHLNQPQQRSQHPQPNQPRSSHPNGPRGSHPLSHRKGGGGGKRFGHAGRAR